MNFPPWIKKYKNPQQIYFNRNCLEDALTSVSKQYSDNPNNSNNLSKRAIIITDRVMCDLEYTLRVERCLENQGFKVAIYDKVQPDPDISTVMDAVEVCNQFKPCRYNDMSWWWITNGCW